MTGYHTPQPRKTHKLPADVRRQLESAIKAAEMTSASFAPGGGFIGSKPYTDEIIAATKLYRDSWIIEPLRELLDWDDGEIGTRELSSSMYRGL